MLKATATREDGKQIVILGLSFHNLDKLRAEPDGATFIRVAGSEIGIPVDILIFVGATEASMALAFQDMIGLGTQVMIDPKLKS